MIVYTSDGAVLFFRIFIWEMIRQTGYSHLMVPVEIEYVNVSIGDSGEAKIREALDILYGVGWRYKEGGGYTPIYRKCCDVFGYDNM